MNDINIIKERVMNRVVKGLLITIFMGVFCFQIWELYRAFFGDTQTNLMVAVIQGNLEKIKKLLNKDTNINFYYEYGNTLLTEAAGKGNLDIVKYLVEHGADVNNMPKTPLMNALRDGDLDIVKYLVDNGADINIRIKNFGTPMSFAIRSGFSDIAKYFIEKKGIPINQQDSQGTTLLMEAALGGNLDIVKYLVDKGADINVHNKQGNTAVMYAAGKGNLDLVKYLVEHGANIKVQNSTGKTPLMGAVEHGHLDIMKYLIGKGADVNARDEKGNTVIMYSAQAIDNDRSNYTRSETLKIIGSLREKIKGQENKNKKQIQREVTPIKVTAIAELYNMVKYLIDHGAVIALKNNEGKTVLDIFNDKSKEISVLIQESQSKQESQNKDKIQYLEKVMKEIKTIIDYLAQQMGQLKKKN